MFKDCQTCALWKNGTTMVDCFAKHHYNKNYGCTSWEDSGKINYTDEDIKNGKIVDPSESAYLCDDSEN